MYRYSNQIKISRNAVILIATMNCLFLLGGAYPFISLLLMMLFSVFAKLNKSIYIFILSNSLFFSLVASVLDLNYTYYADLARYYALFDEYSIEQAFSDLKIYRGIIFELLHRYDLKVEHYSLISMFLVLLLTQMSSIKIIYNLGYKIETLKEKLLYIFITISLIPVVTFLGYETSLAIGFFFYGSYLFTYKSKLFGSVFFVLAYLTHALSIYFIFLFFASAVFQKKGLVFYLSSVGGFLGLLIAVNYKLSTGAEFIDKPLIKLYTYFNGAWSDFTTIHDKAIIPYILLKFVFILLFLNSVKKIKGLDSHYLVKMMTISLPLVVVFMLSRTLSLRLIEFGFIIYLPLIYIFSLSLRTRKARLFIITFIVINIFSYHNMLYTRFFIKNMKLGNDFFLLMNHKNIHDFKSSMASDELIFDIKGN